MRPTRQQLGDARAIIEPLIRYRALMSRTPGVSFGISHDGDPILLGAAGSADLESSAPALPTTGYRVASITKTFTATLVMQLVEQGKLRLDEPVATYLSWTKPVLGSSGVTLRHLLTHSGGIIRDGSCSWTDDGFPDVGRFHADVLGGGTFAEPAVGFRYSNVAYALLGEIIEKATGLGFATAIDRRIVRPLALAASGTRITKRLRSTLATGYLYRRPGEPWPAAKHTEAGAFEPAGGMISNVPDLLAYQQAHFPGSTKLLNDLSKREMQRTQWQRSEEPHHGYGWMVYAVDGVSLRGHSGGYPGFVTRIAFAPEWGVAAAVLTNNLGPLSALAVEMAFHTMAKVAAMWGDAAGPPAGPSRAALRHYTGQFRGEWGEALIALVNKSLYLVDPEEDRPMRIPARLEPSGEHRFLIADNEDYGRRGEHISFSTDKSGRATALHVGPNSLQRADP